MSYASDQLKVLIANKDANGIARLRRNYASSFTPEMDKQLADPNLFGTYQDATMVDGGNGTQIVQGAQQTPWWQPVAEQAKLSGTNVYLDAIKPAVETSPAWSSEANRAILPITYVNAIDKAKADSTAALAKAQADANKPTYLENANAARALGYGWTQADQDAQVAGAPVGWVNQAEQQKYADQLTAKIAPPGANQAVMDTLVQGLQQASSTKPDTTLLQRGMAYNSASSDLSAESRATFQGAINAAIKAGVPAQEVQKNLYMIGMKTGNYSMLADPTLTIPGADGTAGQLFPGVSGNSKLFLDPNAISGGAKYQPSPEGVIALGGLVNKFGITGTDAKTISTKLESYALSQGDATKNTLWKQAGYNVNNMDALTMQVKAAVNPNDPSLVGGTALAQIQQANQQITSNILKPSSNTQVPAAQTNPQANQQMSSAMGTLDPVQPAANPLASALTGTNFAQGSSGSATPTGNTASGVGTGTTGGQNITTPSGVTVNIGGTSGNGGSGYSDFVQATPEQKASRPDLWDAKTGNWIGPRDQGQNFSAYDPVTNPFGQLGVGSTATGGGRTYISQQPGTMPDQTADPVAIYNTQTGGWDKQTIDSATMPNASAGQAALASYLQSGGASPTLASASGALTAGTNVPSFSNTGGTNYSMSGSGGLAKAVANNGTYAAQTGGGSGGGTTGGSPAQVETGLGSGGPTPGITYSDSSAMTPAPFALANALTNNMAAQSLSDTYAAQRNFGLNNPNTQGPLGSTTYENIGTQTNPQYQQTTQIGQNQQFALNNTLAGQASVSGLYGNLASALGQGLNNSVYASNRAANTPQVGNYDVLNPENVANTASRMANPNLGPTVDPTQILNYAGNAPQSDISSLRNVPTGALKTDINDFSGAMTQAQRAAYENFSSLMEPGYQQQQSRMRSQLINQGLQEGSQAYQTAMDNLARQQNYGRTTAANNAVLTGNQTGLAQQQQLAANQGQLYNQTASTQNQGFGQQLQSSNQNFTQLASALQQALSGQLGIAGQQYAQSQGNFNDLYKALATQGSAAAANAQQNNLNTNALANATNTSTAPINSLAASIAALGTPTLPTVPGTNQVALANTPLVGAMMQQAKDSLGNQNALIQSQQQQMAPVAQPTRYGIDANGNVFAM